MTTTSEGDEIRRLKQWIDDLQAGLFINCVYCGFRYGPGESMPATLPEAGETLAAAALREHIERCPDHPMSRFKRDLADARDGIQRAEIMMRSGSYFSDKVLAAWLALPAVVAAMEAKKSG